MCPTEFVRGTLLGFFLYGGDIFLYWIFYFLFGEPVLTHPDPL